MMPMSLEAFWMLNQAVKRMPVHSAKEINQRIRRKEEQERISGNTHIR